MASDAHSFWDHADELRLKVFKSLLAVVFFSFLFSFLVDGLIADITKPVGHLVFTSPADAFVARLSLILIGGFVISLPYVFYQIWQFVALGLKEEEKRYVRMFMPFSVILFVLGVCFAYFLAIPFSVKFLLGYGSEQLVPMITVKSYFSFVSTMVLVFGFVFELPLVLVFLTKIGITTPAFLRHYRAHCVVAIFILSAVITPPDVISLFVMAIPLCFLYEAGIIVSAMMIRSKEKKALRGAKMAVVLLACFLGSTGMGLAQDQKLSRKEALVIAEQTPEAQGFYGLNEGKYANCIEKSVIKPCDSNWVTCIEEAWVVRFELGEICGVEHDGRLVLNVLIDSKDGSVISRFPEKEYFSDGSHCVIDKDCMAHGDGCLNFVSAQLSPGEKGSFVCQCFANKCEKQP